MKRVLIYGAGAIGGFLAASLSRAGHDVRLVARGEHAAAIEHHGLRVEDSHGRQERLRPRLVRQGSKAEPVD
jgi:2-dehydropantoate 2-reductase